MTLPSTSYDTATVLNPTSALTDFSLLVDLSRMSAAWWAEAENTGATRGRAAKDDETELACDWIEYDHAGQTGTLRVKWSGTLAASGTQVLRIYPPVAANDLVAASDTYGSDNAYDSDFAAYYPLDSDYTDRTSNARDMTVADSLDETFETGHIGGSLSFPNTDNTRAYYDAGAGAINSYPATMMCWARIDTGAGTDNVVIGHAASANNGYVTPYSMIRTDATTKWRSQSNTMGSVVSATTEQLLDTWQHVALRASSSEIDLILDGVSKGPLSHSAAVATARYFMLGGKAGGMRGDVDEAQFHQVDRGFDWIEQEYDQSNDQSAFFGTWSNVAPPASGGMPGCGLINEKQLSGSKVSPGCPKKGFVR